MIEEISGDKLNLLPGEYGKWFRSENRDFSVVFNAHEILYFEIHLGEHHLSGGHGKPLRCGRIRKESGKSFTFKRSELIEYEREVEGEVMKDAMDFVSLCELEGAIKGRVLEYLAQHGRRSAALYSDEAFQTFQNALHDKKVKITRRNWRRLAISLGGTSIFLLLLFWTYSLLNISYYERTCQEGEVWSCRQLVFVELVRGNRARMDVFAQLEKEAESKGKSVGEFKLCEEGDFGACLHLHQRGEYALGEARLLEWACKGAHDDFCLFKALSVLNQKRAPLDEGSLARVRSLLGANPKHAELLAAVDIVLGKRDCHPGEDCARYAQRLSELNLLNLAETLYEKGCGTGAWESCEKYATALEQRGEKTLAQALYRQECERNKTPRACFKAAYALLNDPGDRKALTQAYESCLKGAENYCLFLYDRVK